MAVEQDLVNDPFVCNLIRCKARQLIGKAGLTPNDVSELEQELFQRFLQRWRLCKRKPGDQRAFVTLAVTQSLRSYLRDRTAPKRKGDPVSLSAPAKDGDGQATELAQIVTEREQGKRTGRSGRSSQEAADLICDLATVLAGLPDPLRALAKRLEAGDTISRAAKNLGVPRTTTNDHVRRLRRYFERANLRDYL